MKRLFLFLLPVMMLGLTACDKKLTPERAEAAILEGEKGRVPLLLQSLPLVDDITIDSIHWIVTEEPMQGYLYTTWIYKGEGVPIIIQLDSVCVDATRKDYVQWLTSWDKAAQSYMLKCLGF